MSPAPASVSPSASPAAGIQLHLSLGQGFAQSSGAVPVAARPAAPAALSVPRQSLLFGHLGPYAPHWTIREPLPVNFIRDEDGTSIISDEVFPVYGTGDTIAEAMADYVTSLVELYEIVEHDVAEGVPHTRDEFARLSLYLARQR